MPGDKASGPTSSLKCLARDFTVIQHKNKCLNNSFPEDDRSSPTKATLT